MPIRPDFPGTLTDHIRTILAAGAGTVTLGGDHFITLPILRAYAEKFGPMSRDPFRRPFRPVAG